jgi:hypothetical protein
MSNEQLSYEELLELVKLNKVSNDKVSDDDTWFVVFVTIIVTLYLVRFIYRLQCQLNIETHLINGVYRDVYEDCGVRQESIPSALCIDEFVIADAYIIDMDSSPAHTAQNYVNPFPNLNYATDTNIDEMELGIKLSSNKLFDINCLFDTIYNVILIVIEFLSVVGDIVVVVVLHFVLFITYCLGIYLLNQMHVPEQDAHNILCYVYNCIFVSNAN